MLLSASMLMLAASEATAIATDSFVQTEIVYTADIMSNVDGGVETGTRYLDNLTASLTIGSLFSTGRYRDRAYASLLYNNDTTFSDLVGDLQTVSNIDAAGGLRVFEAWYEAIVDKFSLRTGLYDLNSEFDVSTPGGFFLGSSHGIGAEIGQTGENGPGIFPVSALAARVQWAEENLRAKFVVLDAVPGDPDGPHSNEVRLSSDEGALIVGEVDGEIGESARLWAGLWQYTADFESPFDGSQSNDNSGWYVGFEKHFEAAGRAMHAFIRGGVANEYLNPIESYAGIGIVIEGPLSSRPMDQVGVSVASAGLGKPYRDSLVEEGGAAASRETAWELSYRFVIHDRFVIQPDLQYIDSPAGDKSIDDSLVIGVRFEWAIVQ